jgi:TonB-dependent SusC/RagA subfamily outer membrane receptor
MKKLILTTLTIVLFSSGLTAQTGKAKPLALINGKAVNLETYSLDPNSIESVSVLKDQAAINAYGLCGKNGVILITTKKNYLKPDISLKFNPAPLIIVDGEIFSDRLNSIDPGEIQSITVLKGIKAADKYGKAGENGVILIKTKDKNKKSENPAPFSLNTDGILM